MQTVDFPDVDTLARTYLLAGLEGKGVTGIAVATKLPSPMQNRFIRCYSIPGRVTGRRTQSTQVVVFVYDTKGNDIRCQQLARLCASLLAAVPDNVDGPISRPVEVHGPFLSEDPDLSGIPRYQATVTWTVQSTVSD